MSLLDLLDDMQVDPLLILHLEDMDAPCQMHAPPRLQLDGGTSQIECLSIKFSTYNRKCGKYLVYNLSSL